jgi:hypothetical protein
MLCGGPYTDGSEHGPAPQRTLRPSKAFAFPLPGSRCDHCGARPEVGGLQLEPCCKCVTVYYCKTSGECAQKTRRGPEYRRVQRWMGLRTTLDLGLKRDRGFFSSASLNKDPCRASAQSPYFQHGTPPPAPQGRSASGRTPRSTVGTAPSWPTSSSRASRPRSTSTSSPPTPRVSFLPLAQPCLGLAVQGG